MKIRNGFVSNSSSSSFIVHWIYKNEGTLLKALHKLFDVWDEYDEDEDKICWRKVDYKFLEVDEDYRLKCIIEDLINKTKDLNDGKFKTEIWISMRNDYRDFGESIQNFLTVMAIENGSNGNKNFEILSLDTIDDRG